MLTLGTYTFDRASIRLDAYRLLTLFYANKEIARQSNPETRHEAASELEREFFPREMSRLLLNIAIALRALDDQMNALPAADPKRQRYLMTRDHVNAKHACMLFDSMTLREVCNKVVHANIVEAHSQAGTEAHKIDEYRDGEEPTRWEHLSFNVRLGGKKGDENWYHLLKVPAFIAAIAELMAEPA